MTSDLGELKSLRIHFQNKADEERGFYALLTSGMPVVARGSEYVINQKQCQMLSEKQIPYITE
jgi:hypothetical protein